MYVKGIYLKAYAKDGQDANSFSSDDEYILHACYAQGVSKRLHTNFDRVYFFLNSGFM